ncbi:MAG: hypothetical protein HUJ91_04110 [Bacteroidales bacterium]|nr:hypothetical protein [Bacteroidales bacterium]
MGEAIKAIIKVFGFLAILLLVIVPAVTGTALGVRYVQEQTEGKTASSSTNTTSSAKVINARQAEDAKVAAQREADRTHADLIREKRKADRQYYLMNFPWGDLILIIMCVLGTIGCIIYIINN